MQSLFQMGGSAAALLASVRPVFAYIDPNTGGMLFQLLAVILASLTGILLFFSRQIQVTIARAKRVLRRGAADVSGQHGDNVNREVHD